MKKYFIFLLLNFFVEGNLFAQKQGNIWHFGKHAGINFNSGNPVAIWSPILTAEGCSSICDTSGNLLFSTDGITVYNSIGDTMASGLFGHASSTQSALIIPFPMDNSKYYIFTADAQGGSNGICYSVVDMSLNGGLGGLLSLNTQLLTPACEKLVAVINTNGTDYWVICHANPSSEYYAYPITVSGVGIPIITQIGLPSNGGAIIYGYLKCSPNGQKLAAARWATNQPIELFDFDASNGILSNSDTISGLSSSYCISLSSNSMKLYVSGGNSSPYYIVQYDLTLPNFQNFPYTVTQGNGLYMGAIQLGPDGKIYCSKYLKNTIAAINNPNLSGAACGYVDSALFFLPNTLSESGLPNFIESYFNKSDSSSESVSTISSQNNFNLYPNPATNQLTVESEKAINAIEITDALGRVQSFKFKVQRPATQIDIHALASGIYFIKVYFGDGTMEVRKFVKE